MRHLGLFMVLLLAACTSYDRFGQKIDTDDPVPVADVLAAPGSYTGREVTIRGPIQSVCKKKGCWIRVGNEKETILVRFKDYGFFVPKDSAGRQVVMTGTLAAKMQSVAEIKHLLEDAGKHEEAKQVTEPRKIYGFTAVGVAIEQ